MKRRAAVLLLLGARLAAAQPMIDPAQMSGIPRPDGAVPAGSVTVRLLRGDFAHGLVGQEVTLAGPGAGEKKVVKTDEGGRATFSGLAAGATYVASASAFGQTLESRPIALPPSTGVRVMLVFPRDEAADLGAPDGKARPDPKLAAGEIDVKLVDENDRPLAGVKVALAHAKKGTDKLDETGAVTDATGLARFTGLPPAPDDGYVAKALRKDAPVASAPFRLDGRHGMLVGLRAVPLARDVGQLRIAERSHFIIELRDEEVSLVENFLLDNQSGAPLDPGPGGLRFPLPAEASGPQLAEGNPAGTTIDTSASEPAIVVKGPIPAGQSELRFGVLLPLHEGTITLRQAMPIAHDDLLAVVDHVEGLEAEGSGVQKQERSMPGGRTFWVVSMPAAKGGGELYLRLTGLPRPSTFGRFAAVTLAAAILLWGVFVMLRPRAGGPGVPASRAELEQRRLQLLDQLAAVDAAAPRGGARAPARRGERGATDGKLARRRDELYVQLEKVYRALDEATG